MEFRLNLLLNELHMWLLLEIKSIYLYENAISNLVDVAWYWVMHISFANSSFLDCYLRISFPQDAIYLGYTQMHDEYLGISQK